MFVCFAALPGARMKNKDKDKCEIDLHLRSRFVPGRPDGQLKPLELKLGLKSAALELKNGKTWRIGSDLWRLWRKIKVSCCGINI